MMKDLAVHVFKIFGDKPWTLYDLLAVTPPTLLPIQTQYILAKGGSRQAVAISLGKQFRRTYPAYFVASIVRSNRYLWQVVDCWKPYLVTEPAILGP